MKEREEIEEFVVREMKRLNYSTKSIEIYKVEILKLNSFYVDKELEDVSIAEIKTYIEHLQSERLKVSASAINQAFHAFTLLYNKIWKKNFNFNSIQRPERHRSNPDFFTTQEIMKDTGYRKGMCFRNVNCVYSLLFFRAFLSSFLSSCDAAELKIESAVFLLPFCSSAHRFKRQNMMVFVKDLVCLRSSL
jgi:hypothetical protein